MMYLDGSGTRTVDWGDGKSQDVTLVSGAERLTHAYAASGSHTIKINGMVTVLACAENQLTVLDVSKNTALTELWCADNKPAALDVSKNTALTDLYCDGNQLTALDVSKNTDLTSLWCGENQLTAGALNALFGTLHGNTIELYVKVISISGNPGTAGCNRTIATQKGWTFQ